MRLGLTFRGILTSTVLLMWVGAEGIPKATAQDSKPGQEEDAQALAKKLANPVSDRVYLASPDHGPEWKHRTNFAVLLPRK